MKEDRKRYNILHTRNLHEDDFDIEAERNAILEKLDSAYDKEDENEKHKMWDLFYYQNWQFFTQFVKFLGVNFKNTSLHYSPNKYSA